MFSSTPPMESPSTSKEDADSVNGGVLVVENHLVD